MTVLPFQLPIPEPASAPLPGARPAPTLLYDSPAVTVYHGAAEDVLPMIPKESVDLIATDPPYGVDWQSNRRAEKLARIDNDGAADRDTVHRVLTECVRIVRQHRHLYVFGPTDVLDGLKVAKPVELVWDKRALGSGDVTAPWAPAHETLTFTVSKFRHAGDIGKATIPARLRKGSVLSYTRPTGTKVRHPSEKPVALMRELLESSTRQGEVVLDPFAGSGSTGVAAVLCGRRAILVEKRAEWATMTVQRVQAAEALAAQMGAL